MIVLHKKGDKTDPSNYRTITLMNTLPKIFMLLLNKRLYKWALLNKKIGVE